MDRQRTNEEQMALRQSAPKPTMLDGAVRAQMKAEPRPATDAFNVLNAPIGKEAVLEATQILQKYKEGKANLEKRIIENEQWYKLRHWECMRHEKKSGIEPTSGWLFNCIANKQATAMDSYPSPNVLPREEGDKAEAEKLSSILPVILEQNDFEKTYSDVWWYKLIAGTGVYGVFWDNSKLNGLGDISITKCDILNLFWQPGITDIQKSRNLFHVELMDNDLLEQQYPQTRGKLSTPTVTVAEFLYDDAVKTDDKSCVIDWYYKKNVNGKTLVHMCKYVNDVVLFATENDPNLKNEGLYQHGKYPFIFDALFSNVEGTPAGFGFIDIGKSAQEYIDRGNKAILQNMLANTRPRHFIKNDGSVNEEEYADIDNDFVHVDGNLGQDSILPIQGKPLSDIYVNVITQKIEELKETMGNSDVSRGSTPSGITAASAIAALQEASSRLDRSSIRSSYRAFRELALLCIELIRQFYDLPRCFRIMGENGTMRYIQYSNAMIKPQAQGSDFGLDMGSRLPIFDITVTAEKQSPYSKMAQNELALQFYNAGFFNPQMADQALLCLDMMDFERKDFIMQKIQQNGTMLQQMMMLAQMVDNAYGGNEISMGIAQQYNIPVAGGMNPEAMGEQSKAFTATEGEASNTRKARERVAEQSTPM